MAVNKRNLPRFASNRFAVWELDQTAQRYGQRPSTFFGLPGDGWIAYQLDTMCASFGRWIDNQLSDRDKSGNPKKSLAQLLQVDDTKATAQSYRKPAGVTTIPAGVDPFEYLMNQGKGG